MGKLSKQTYFKGHNLQTNLKNSNTQTIHNPKNTTCCPSHHTSATFSLAASLQAVLSLLSHSPALCLSPRQPSHHFPLFISLPSAIQPIHIFLGCLHPKDMKASICSRLPATGVFISLFLH